MALRFARVLRYRDDKTAGEADTVETVRSLHARGERTTCNSSCQRQLHYT